MKRYGRLYEQICSFENLLSAAYRARRGKRYRPDVSAFHYDLERRLLMLRAELTTRTYRPGVYKRFTIRDPKPRQICAAPYRDRIVHHALCSVIAPIFDKGFIHDSYAGRSGKGTHKALDRCTFFARRFSHVLKCDIEKYYYTIDHDILMALIARKIKCPDTLWLIHMIVTNFDPQEDVFRYFPGDDLFTPLERRRGIPIGNLTSQLFGNIYMNGLDHFMKQSPRCRAYIRFADDFLIFADERKWLEDLRPRIQQFLNGLRLCLHPRKRQVTPTRVGVDFLGWLVYPERRRLRRSTGVRFQRRLRSLQEEYMAGQISSDHIRSSVASWIGHLKHGDTWGLRRKLLASAPFGRFPESQRQGETRWISK